MIISGLLLWLLERRRSNRTSDDDKSPLSISLIDSIFGDSLINIPGNSCIRLSLSCRYRHRRHRHRRRVVSLAKIVSFGRMS